MTGRHAEGALLARARAAKGVRADFERQDRAAQLGDLDLDWLSWARRLSVVLGAVLDLLTVPAAASTLLLPDGSGFLAVEDVLALVTIARKLGGPG